MRYAIQTESKVMRQEGMPMAMATTTSVSRDMLAGISATRGGPKKGD